MRQAKVLSAMLAALLLAGCDPSETAQRMAFVDFLKTCVLDKPGIHVPGAR